MSSTTAISLNLLLLLEKISKHQLINFPQPREDKMQKVIFEGTHKKKEEFGTVGKMGQLYCLLDSYTGYFLLGLKCNDSWIINYNKEKS